MLLLSEEFLISFDFAANMRVLLHSRYEMPQRRISVALPDGFISKLELLSEANGDLVASSAAYLLKKALDEEEVKQTIENYTSSKARSPIRDYFKAMSGEGSPDVVDFQAVAIALGEPVEKIKETFDNAINARSFLG